ncbi:MAG: heme-binding domain-containing protein [Flavobacteriales bacterium]|nr:heme-binding domain-containing protein [Flavobacteriales bacterium]
MKKKILLALLVILIGIQFIRVDKSVPKYRPSNDFIVSIAADGPAAVKFKEACYDCHSYETTYPWYFNIAPVSWWLKGHINGGRKHLNFSEWAAYSDDDRAHALKEMQEEIEEKHMPLGSYTWTHPEARLSDEDRAMLITWLGTIAAGPLD